jgi:hypothetical protein
MGPSLWVWVLGREEGDMGGAAGAWRGEMRVWAVSWGPCWIAFPKDRESGEDGQQRAYIFWI